MEALLGNTLTGKEGDVPTSSLGAKVVGLYFSAHWCPPCRGFTPKLVEFYNKVKANGSSFEIVFISSDRDEKSFQEYFGEMPWLSLPYSNRELKQKLSSKFKVSGIPTFLLLDGETGAVTNKSGREVVMGDPEGANYPWLPKTFQEIVGGKLVDKSGAEFDYASATAGKVKGLYFSAHWCPPCRGFTPALAKTYEAITAAGKNFEIIFCSGDHDENSFKEYLNEMPWKALPFKDPREKELSTLFEVSGIPHLVILDENDKIITDNGRAAVSSDPEGNEFPWHPKPLEELGEATAQTVNEHACLIAFTDGKEENVNHVKSILQSHAETEHAKGVDNKEIFFFWGGEDDICTSIRDFCGLDDEPENLIILLNIPGQEIHVCDQAADSATSETIGDIVSQFQAGTLKSRSIR